MTLSTEIGSPSTYIIIHWMTQ